MKIDFLGKMINSNQPYCIIKVEKRFTAEERRDSSENPFYIASANKKIVMHSPNNS